MSGYFITGTDTDVGKTIATALLSLYFKKRGKGVFPYKPIQSGAISQNGTLHAPDVLLYSQALPTLDTIEACTYLLKKPYSPHLAAKEDSIKIEVNKIQEKIKSLQLQHSPVLVEGAGGVMVPITDDGYDMRTFMKDLNFPVILVARAGLGTLNHTLLSILALEAEQIPIAGILLNQLEEDGDSAIEEDNKKMLKELTNVPIIGTIPYIKNQEKLFQNPEWLEAFFQSLDHHLLEEATNL